MSLLEKISHIRTLYEFICASKADGREILETAPAKDTILLVPLVRVRLRLRIRAAAKEGIDGEDLFYEGPPRSTSQLRS